MFQKFLYKSIRSSCSALKLESVDLTFWEPKQSPSVLGISLAGVSAVSRNCSSKRLTSPTGQRKYLPSWVAIGQALPSFQHSEARFALRTWPPAGAHLGQGKTIDVQHICTILYISHSFNFQHKWRRIKKFNKLNQSKSNQHGILGITTTFPSPRHHRWCSLWCCSAQGHSFLNTPGSENPLGYWEFAKSYRL